MLLKRRVRASKTDPLVDEVELLQANPQYAHIRYQDGKEDTVSTRHLAPAGSEHQAQSQDMTGTAPASNAHEIITNDDSGLESSNSDQVSTTCARGSSGVKEIDTCQTLSYSL